MPDPLNPQGSEPMQVPDPYPRQGETLVDFRARVQDLVRQYSFYISEEDVTSLWANSQYIAPNPGIAQPARSGFGFDAPPSPQPGSTVPPFRAPTEEERIDSGWYDDITPDFPEAVDPQPVVEEWRAEDALPPELVWHARTEPGIGHIRLFVGSRDSGVFRAAWTALVAFATYHNLEVFRYHTARIDVNGIAVSVPDIVIVRDPNVNGDTWTNWNAIRLSLGTAPCSTCGVDGVLGVPVCAACSQRSTCDLCNAWDSTIVLDRDHEGAMSVRACTNCLTPCDEVGCNVRSQYEFCLAHAEGNRAHCANCGNYTDDGVGATYSEYYGGTVCDDCRTYDCSECGHNGFLSDDGLCEDCEVTQRVTARMGAHGTEEFEVEEKSEAELVVDSIPGRENIRRCGLEIEGAGNFRPMGSLLYDQGLTVGPSLGEYHQSTREGGYDLWSLERDGSVDWELVSPPINLADVEDIRNLRKVLKVVRDQIAEEKISFDMRCGLHIHVSAERTAIGGAFNLGTIWGYLEDVIFRLGAAKWSKHRAIVNGVNYCRPTLKGAKTRLEFGLQLDRANDETGRYGALSFQNYISSMSRKCVCGAVRYDSWDQCVCDLGKCTFEFRVFNTSANMHKIHAYLALCQALVAYSTNRADLDPDQFPAQEFIPKLVSDMGERVQAVHVDNWKPRLQFIFNELPLTEAEKADLFYCVQSSELAVLGDEFLGSLTNAQEVLL